MASFLYCSPYSCHSFLIIKAIEKSEEQIKATTFAIAIVGRGINTKREIKDRSKENIAKCSKIIRAITLQGAILEK